MSSSTFSGPVTSTAGFIGDRVNAVVTAEHGAGAIGTGTQTAPQTRRWTENGVIVTQIKFDISGLGVKGGNADDVIGLVTAAPDAYLGRNVVATNGVIYKVQLTCLEAPGEGTATITQDIDIATNSSSTLGYDEAGGSAKLFNTATLVVTETLENLTPNITANDYYYLVEADTAASTGIYNAGQFMLTFWGHPLLT